MKLRPIHWPLFPENMCFSFNFGLFWRVSEEGYYSKQDLQRTKDRHISRRFVVNTEMIGSEGIRKPRCRLRDLKNEWSTLKAEYINWLLCTTADSVWFLVDTRVKKSNQICSILLYSQMEEIPFAGIWNPYGSTLSANPLVICLLFSPAFAPKCHLGGFVSFFLLFFYWTDILMGVGRYTYYCEKL